MYVRSGLAMMLVCRREEVIYKMNDLVQIVNGKPTTTSLKVAEVFEQQHKNVLQAISRLKHSQEFTELNFQPSAYTDPTGRSLPCYILTKDGLCALVFGFNTVKAKMFTEMYIAAFNEMEEQLRGRKGLLDYTLREVILEVKTLFNEPVESSKTIVIESHREEVALSTYLRCMCFDCKFDNKNRGVGGKLKRLKQLMYMEGLLDNVGYPTAKAKKDGLLRLKATTYFTYEHYTVMLTPAGQELCDRLLPTKLGAPLIKTMYGRAEYVIK